MEIQVMVLNGGKAISGAPSIRCKSHAGAI